MTYNCTILETKVSFQPQDFQILNAIENRYLWLMLFKLHRQTDGISKLIHTWIKVD